MGAAVAVGALAVGAAMFGYACSNSRGTPNHAPPSRSYVDHLYHDSAAERRRLERDWQYQEQQRAAVAQAQWAFQQQQAQMRLDQERQEHELELQRRRNEQRMRERREQQRRQAAQQREDQRLAHERWEREQREQQRLLEEKRRAHEEWKQEQQRQAAIEEAELQRTARQVEEQERALQARVAKVERQEAEARKAEEELRNYPMAEYQTRAGWEGTINVGVAGEVSVGKSTFINVVRGMTPRDPGAAPVGVNQKTLKPTAYPFPQQAAVRLWDLPGYGTKEFQQRTKLRDMGIRYYDAIVLMCDGPLKESMLEVMRELRQYKVPCFVVRNKIDEAIESNLADFGRTETQTKQEVSNTLAKQGVQGSYLITCRDANMQQHHFPQLITALKAAVERARS